MNNSPIFQHTGQYIIFLIKMSCIRLMCQHVHNICSRGQSDYRRIAVLRGGVEDNQRQCRWHTIHWRKLQVVSLTRSAVAHLEWFTRYVYQADTMPVAHYSLLSSNKSSTHSTLQLGNCTYLWSLQLNFYLLTTIHTCSTYVAKKTSNQ